MKFYVDCGEGLRIDWSLAIPYYRAPDYTMAHLHPHHELLFILDPLPYSAVIDGKILHGKGPVVMAIAPYCMHFTYYLDERIQDKRYIATYIDEAFRKTYPEEIAPILNVMGNSKAVFFDIGEKADEFRAIMDLITSQFAKKSVPLSELWRKTNVKQQLLFGVLINMLNEIRMSGDKVQSVMGENNYIMDVIVYIIQNLDKKLTPRKSHRSFLSAWRS